MEPSIIISSLDDRFFEFVERRYHKLRRAGLELRLELVDYAGGRHWVVLAPPEVALRAKELTCPEAADDAPDWTDEADADRSYAALLRLQRGESLASIAATLPNRRGRPTVGVSEKTVELIVRGACRVLLTGVMLGRKPEGLPEELWPPETVRAAIRDTPAGLSRRARLDLLRAWVAGRPPNDRDTVITPARADRIPERRAE